LTFHIHPCNTKAREVRALARRERYTTSELPSRRCHLADPTQAMCLVSHGHRYHLASAYLHYLPRPLSRGSLPYLARDPGRTSRSQLASPSTARCKPPTLTGGGATNRQRHGDARTRVVRVRGVRVPVDHVLPFDETIVLGNDLVGLAIDRGVRGPVPGIHDRLSACH